MFSTYSVDFSILQGVWTTASLYVWRLNMSDRKIFLWIIEFLSSWKCWEIHARNIRTHYVAVIQTDFQRRMVTRLHCSTLCVDDTHHTAARSDMKLVNLMGLDESGKGVPLPHILTNKVDKEGFLIGLFSLKDQFVVKDTAYLLSDDALAFFNAWENCLESVKLKKFCARGMLDKLSTSVSIGLSRTLLSQKS